MKIKEDLIFDASLSVLQMLGRIITTLTILNDSVTIQLKMSTRTLPLTCLCHGEGYFTSLEFPYGQFPTRDVSADTMFPIVWDAGNELD